MSLYLGWKRYEIANHLGNVTATVSDRKRPVDTNTDGTAEYYNPTILSATDYYPFGMDMPNRTFNAGDYRFGFNGKEKDENEEWGSLTHYDYGFRIYNPGIGRFLSVDPLTRDYPSWSPYPFAMNRPIDGIDVDGLEWTSQTFDETYFGKTMKRVSYLDVNIKIINNSSLTSAEVRNLKKEVTSQFGSTFSNFDSNTRRQFIAQGKDITIENVDDAIDRKFNGLVVEITDEMIFESKVPYVGKTSNSSGRNVSSQHNHINIVNKNSSTSQMAQTILHELGHAAGLDHIWESRVYNIDGTVFSLGAPQDIFDLNEEVKFEFPFEQVEVERPDGGPPTLIPVLRPSKKKKAIFDNLMNSPGNIHRLNIPPLEYTRELRTTISQLIQMNRKIESEDKN